MTGAGAPLLAIVAGQPSAEETAAVVAVVAVLSARPAQAATGPPGAGGRSGWSAASGLLRAPVRAGHGAWRASALPR